MRLAAILAAAVAAATFAGVASADRAGFTRGDAEAVFNAGPGGGNAILVHAPNAEGAPAQQDVRIRPFASFAGDHVCASDWHVVNVVLITGGDSTFTHEQAVAELSPFVFHWTLDGAPLAAEVRPVKRFLDPGRFDLDVAYWMTSGTILSPDALAPGEHVIHLMIDNFYGPGTVEDPGPITFYVDAPGAGACV